MVPCLAPRPATARAAVRRRAIALAPILAAALCTGINLGRSAPAAAQPSAPAGAAWEVHLGGFADLEDVVAVGPEDVWAVGDGIVRWDGTDWRQVLPEPRPRLRAIAALPGGAMWAAGALRARDGCDLGPVVLRYDGEAWQAEPVESHQPLWDVAMVAPDEGWAVGGVERPVILRYDGTAWRPFAEPEIGPLRAIAMAAPDDGWAVGLDGALARWDGRDWLAVAPPRTEIDLHDVALVDGGFGWAVGAGTDARAGTILTLRDGAWRIERLDRDPLLTAIVAPAREVALAVGRYGTLVQWDGIAWRDIGRTYPGGFVPTAGEETEGIDQGRDSWERTRRDQTLAERVYLRGLAVLVDAESILAVGDAGQVVVVEAGRYQAVHAWRRLSAVDLLSDGSEGWIVGPDGPPLRYDGTAWRPEPGPIETTWLRDVDAVAPGLAWAAGEAGTVMRFADGRWQRVPFPSTADLSWIRVGADGTGWTAVNRFDENTTETAIYRWDGRAWHQAIRLCGVYTSGGAADDRGGAWFAASTSDAERSSALLRFDGSAWTWQPVAGAERPSDPIAPPRQLLVTPDGSGWGWSNGLVRLDGSTWRSLLDFPSETWRSPYRVRYVDALAAVDRRAAWALVDDYAWDAGDVERGTGGSWVVWFAPDAGYDPAKPDRALGNAHLSPVPLHDLAAARLPDGSTEVWAVGEGATILRFRQPAPAAVPAATATRMAYPTTAWPTPTPHAVLVREAALETLQTMLVDWGGEDVAVDHLELVDRASALSRFERTAAQRGRDVRGGWSRNRGLDRYSGRCLPGWEPWWWFEATVAEHRNCTRFVGAIDATHGDSLEALCLSDTHWVYLPFAQSPRTGPVEPTETPRPTSTPRSLATLPAANVDGPCPTPTPYPTSESWPYP